ncbi:hypothetical protein [Modestobacter altitudinis]|uniref:hypothetical protein n=1 Tax=Modestobacter altitudinis TaxID=2213158 RepID=UPI0014868039|nr:hypothetical protein [Modestobacter altitudinis]
MRIQPADDRAPSSCHTLRFGIRRRAETTVVLCWTGAGAEQLGCRADQAAEGELQAPSTNFGQRNSIPLDFPGTSER